MAVTAKYFGGFVLSLFNGEIDLDSHTLKLMLCGTTYTPDQDTHRYKNQVTGEVSGSGYTAGGTVVSGITLSYNGSTNVASFTGGNATWSAATLVGANAPRWAVLYDSTPGTDATRPLIGYIDFGGTDYAPNGGPLTIQWDAAGIGAATVA